MFGRIFITYQTLARAWLQTVNRGVAPDSAKYMCVRLTRFEYNTNENKHTCISAP